MSYCRRHSFPVQSQWKEQPFTRPIQQPPSFAIVETFSTPFTAYIQIDLQRERVNWQELDPVEGANMSKFPGCDSESTESHRGGAHWPRLLPILLPDKGYSLAERKVNTVAGRLLRSSAPR
ncbi:hypothetical protein K0M31_012996 [Melipona bicolor]|uniref:Uncharacterized protein n=1 Tax=Melipona bicolor TaxID=60889 RepID=A0AA40KH61_9HYME|nr:hypothetical protein K0M31_012996 [Melipona bicolor]